MTEYPGATIGGGGFNNAGLCYSTVSGGSHNSAIAGGGTVGGGYDNLAQGYSATVGGGSNNTAFGGASTVPGGSYNTAWGQWSFAAGLRAKAQHQGSFVWGDSQYMDKASSVRDEFSVFASGGVRLFTGLGATTGVTLAPGSGSWSSASSRASKENLEAVDGRMVLDSLVALPLWTWNYRTQDEGVRHMGPTSQDFREAFGLGISDERIDTVDPDGVALAAIQGLHALVSEKDAELERLRAELAAVVAEVASIREAAGDLR